ncbi:unnamed protein product [Meganyctiphanes norvegica]|uniref:Anoctamin n=1 Tax=Meganyctiphanes norvegica TaxID=48144 RepID=A0AAV2R143_MEGNR
MYTMDSSYTNGVSDVEEMEMGNKAGDTVELVGSCQDLFVIVSSVEDKDQSHSEKRKVFEENLREEDLQLKEEIRNNLRCVKIDITLEVCKIYADFLQLRMPMKQTNLNLLGDLGAQKQPPLSAVYNKDKEYLFDVTENSFSNAIKCRIIDFILRRTRFEPKDGSDLSFGIDSLLDDGTYVAAYPVHEEEVLDQWIEQWKLCSCSGLRSLYDHETLDALRNYFGEKIALYFAWLGFYTMMLIPAAVVGILCLIYPLATLSKHKPSQDICNADNVTMCPLCDTCDVWPLNETCVHSKISYVIDNPATLFFALFMAFWGALFQEMWKRYSASLIHHWGLTGVSLEEQPPRPQYLAMLSDDVPQHKDPVSGRLEPRPDWWSIKLPRILASISTIILLFLVAVTAVISVIIYRMSVRAALALSIDESWKVSILTSMSAAFLNLIILFILNKIYDFLAEKMTEIELHRTQKEFEDSLALKLYILKFVNYYTSIFYIAFFKGAFIGAPDDYNRLFGYRVEECPPGGCLLELTMQLAIIMVGKQILNNFQEIVLPWMYRRWRQWRSINDESGQQGPRWLKDYFRVHFGTKGLFDEYLEMILQYGFVTIFVSSFPMAPLFALINNVIEFHLDSEKLLTLFRRPVAVQDTGIGIWFNIITSIGSLSVLSNAFIIAFTSTFIPELVYTAIGGTGNLDGFVNSTLSVFNVTDYSAGQQSHIQQNIELCRYPGYRFPPNGDDNEYKLRPIFWHILMARLAFVIVFQNVVWLVIKIITLAIPDVPEKLQLEIRQERYMANSLILKHEQDRAKERQEVRLRRTTTHF